MGRWLSGGMENLADGQRIITVIPGIIIPLDCLPAVWEVFQGQYDIPNCEPDTIIDIGANVGLFAIWAKEKWPCAKVLCYEPHPETFKYLENNATFAMRFNNAIGDCRIITLFDSTNRLCSSQYDLGHQFPDKPRINIMVQEPAYLVKPEGDCLMKIDAEGAEAYICENLAWTPKWLVCECHSQTLFERVRKALGKTMKMVQVLPQHENCFLAKFERL